MFRVRFESCSLKSYRINYKFKFRHPIKISIGGYDEYGCVYLYLYESGWFVCLVVI